MCATSLLSFLSFCFSSVSNLLSPMPSCPASPLLRPHQNQLFLSILSLSPLSGLLVVVGLGSKQICVGLMCASMVWSDLWWFDMCFGGDSWVWLIFLFVFLFPVDGGDADVGLGLWFGCDFGGCGLWFWVVVTVAMVVVAVFLLSFCFSLVSNFLSPMPSCSASPLLPLNWNQLSHFMSFHSPLSGWLVAIGLGFDRIYGGLMCFSGDLWFDWFSFLFFFSQMMVMWLWVCDLVVILIVRSCGSGGWW